MISTIIFSFDRAMQLELLLDSISKYDSSKLLQVHVIYTTSSDSFEAGYKMLKVKFPLLQWHKEYQFEDRFVWPVLPFYWHNYYWWLRYKHNRTVKSNFNLLVQQILKESQSEFAMFLTDDSMFVDSIEIKTIFLDRIRKNKWNYCYSLRHGKNLFGGKYIEEKDGIEADRNDKHEHSEWSYPFSVDGHIYSMIVIRKLFRKIIFKNPNTLEGNIAHYVRAKGYFNHLMANKQSCLLGFELNRVQTISDNNNLNISNKTLNDAYLDGCHIVLDYTLPQIHLFRPVLNKVSVINKSYSILLYEK
jgi:hypothetical protein